jgi:hypothetical protein
VAEDPSRDRSLIQNYSASDKYSETLEVVRGFKGTHKKLINITFDMEGVKSAGMCPLLYHFEINREFLVFAYGKDYEVQTACSDTHAIPTDKESFGYEDTQEEIKKLGSFWFRLRARLNPF